MRNSHSISKPLIVAASVALLACMEAAAAGEPAFVVKLADMKRQAEYKIMSQAELKELEKDLQAEAKVFPQAVVAASKEWRSDEQWKSLPFPGGRLSPRKVVGQPDRCANEEEANKKLTAYQDAEARKLKKEREKQQEMAKKDPKAAAAAAAKEKDQQEKDIQLDKAMEMVKAKMDELTGKPALPEGDTNKPPAKVGEKAPAKEPDKAKAKEHAGKSLDKAL